MSRTLKRWTAQITCLALLFAALAPSVAYAVTAVSHDGWTEICSVNGDKWVQADSRHPSSAPAKDGAHLSHCPFCLTHANSLALPSSIHLVAPLPLGVSVQPALFYLAPRPLSAWVPSQSRAPPRFS